MPEPLTLHGPVADARPSRRQALARAGAGLLAGVAAAALPGCALGPFADPPRVDVAGLDSLPGEGLEVRFLLRLRVQNPNGFDLDYDGISLDLDLRGQRFASGVAPVRGTIARFGEALIGVPVTVSGLSVARQLLGLVREGQRPGGVGPVAYVLRGKLGGGALGGLRFESSGNLDLSGR